MLVQDPQTGYFHEVPNYNVDGYEGYGEYDGYGWYGWYGEGPDPQTPPGPDPQHQPVPPPHAPPPAEDPASMYPDGSPYPVPPPPPAPTWPYWSRQWGWNPLLAWRRRRYLSRNMHRGAWPGRWGVWGSHRAGWPGRAGWARRWAGPRSPLMSAARRVFARPARGYVRDHRRR